MFVSSIVCIEVLLDFDMGNLWVSELISCFRFWYILGLGLMRLVFVLVLVMMDVVFNIGLFFVIVVFFC